MLILDKDPIKNAKSYTKKDAIKYFSILNESFKTYLHYKTKYKEELEQEYNSCNMQLSDRFSWFYLAYSEKNRIYYLSILATLSHLLGKEVYASKLLYKECSLKYVDWESENIHVDYPTPILDSDPSKTFNSAFFYSSIERLDIINRNRLYYISQEYPINAFISGIPYWYMNTVYKDDSTIFEKYDNTLNMSFRIKKINDRNYYFISKDNISWKEVYNVPPDIDLFIRIISTNN